MKPTEKKVAVVISGSPRQEDEAHEIVRMAIGLTLRNPEVYLFLLGGAMRGLEYVEGPSGLESPFRGHLSAFLDLGCPVIVEKEALTPPADLPSDAKIQAWSREEIVLFVSRCQAVVIHQVRGPCRHGLGPITELTPFDPVLPSCHEERRGSPICSGDPFPRILHLSVRDQGELFREVIDGQARRNRVTLVLSQDGSSAGVVAGDVLEAVFNDRGGRHRRIGYEELLDLIFQHETVICW